MKNEEKINTLIKKIKNKSIIKNTFIKKFISNNKNILEKFINDYSIFIHFSIMLLSLSILFLSTNLIYNTIAVNLIIIDGMLIIILQEYHLIELSKSNNKSLKKLKKEYDCMFFYENQEFILTNICTILIYKVLFLIIFKMSLSVPESSYIFSKINLYLTLIKDKVINNLKNYRS